MTGFIVGSADPAAAAQLREVPKTLSQRKAGRWESHTHEKDPTQHLLERLMRLEWARALPDFKQLGRAQTSGITQNMIARRQRWAWLALVVVLVGAACIGVPVIRRPILRAAGWALVVNERVEPADIIVVSVDADGAGALEAADLIHSGMATRVAIFTGPPDPVGHEFIRRGVPYEDEAARSVRQLRSLGVEAIDQIPGSISGTEGQGPVLADWCNRQGFRSVIVVSTADHSRRLRRVLHRSLKGHQTRVMVHPTSARYPHFDPDRWWESRDGVRVEIEEGEKLLLDVLRHPIS